MQPINVKQFSVTKHVCFFQLFLLLALVGYLWIHGSHISVIKNVKHYFQQYVVDDVEKYPQFPHIRRPRVPGEFRIWEVFYAEYEPINFTSPKVDSRPPWADHTWWMHQLNNLSAIWNDFDFLCMCNRTSDLGRYVVANNIPRNPKGRTGIVGRGSLGRWGPNRAAEFVLTRFNEQIQRLEMLCVQRNDTGQWSLPGGMINPGEREVEAAKREFLEEAFSIPITAVHHRRIYRQINHLFASATNVFRGYMKDPRNTDNAWVESAGYHVHDWQGLSWSLPFAPGDQTTAVAWLDVSKAPQLFSSHGSIVQAAVKQFRPQPRWNKPLQPLPAPVIPSSEPPAHLHSFNHTDNATLS